ncbi:MAG: HEAT repeat domain-containing protein, partial [Candidatus Omnitrophota bacterium]
MLPEPLLKEHPTLPANKIPILEAIEKIKNAQVQAKPEDTGGPKSVTLHSFAPILPFMLLGNVSLAPQVVYAILAIIALGGATYGIYKIIVAWKRFHWADPGYEWHKLLRFSDAGNLVNYISLGGIVVFLCTAGLIVSPFVSSLVNGILIANLVIHICIYVAAKFKVESHSFAWIFKDTIEKSSITAILLNAALLGLSFMNPAVLTPFLVIALTLGTGLFVLITRALKDGAHGPLELTLGIIAIAILFITPIISGIYLWDRSKTLTKHSRAVVEELARDDKQGRILPLYVDKKEWIFAVLANRDKEEVVPDMVRVADSKVLSGRSKDAREVAGRVLDHFGWTPESEQKELSRSDIMQLVEELRKREASAKETPEVILRAYFQATEILLREYFKGQKDYQYYALGELCRRKPEVFTTLLDEALMCRNKERIELLESVLSKYAPEKLRTYKLKRARKMLLPKIKDWAPWIGITLGAFFFIFLIWYAIQRIRFSKYPDELFEELIKLEKGDPAAKLEAIGTLTEMKDPRALKYLTKALSGSDEAVQKKAREAIEAISKAHTETAPKPEDTDGPKSVTLHSFAPFVPLALLGNISFLGSSVIYLVLVGAGAVALFYGIYKTEEPKKFYTLANLFTYASLAAITVYLFAMGNIIPALAATIISAVLTINVLTQASILYNAIVDHYERAGITEKNWTLIIFTVGSIFFNALFLILNVINPFILSPEVIIIPIVILLLATLFIYMLETDSHGALGMFGLMALFIGSLTYFMPKGRDNDFRGVYALEEIGRNFKAAFQSTQFLAENAKDEGRAGILAHRNRSEAVAALLSVLRDGNKYSQYKREGAAEALELMGWKPANDEEKALYLLARLVMLDSLADEEKARCLLRLNELVRIGKPAVRVLIRELSIPCEDTPLGSFCGRSPCSKCRNRELAAKALGKIGAPAAVDALINALSDANSSVRYAADEALEQIGWSPKNTAEKVRYLFAKRSWEGLAQAGKPAVGTLVKALSHERTKIREKAAETLGKIKDPGTIPTLAKALSDEEWSVRIEAAKALGEVQAQTAAAALAAALEDENWRVCRTVAESLVKLGRTEYATLSRVYDAIHRKNMYVIENIGQQAIPPLVKAFKHGNIFAAAALVRLQVQPMVSETIVPFLIKELSQKDVSDEYEDPRRISIIRSLGETRDARAAQTLLDELMAIYGAMEDNDDSISRSFEGLHRAR